MNVHTDVVGPDAPFPFSPSRTGRDPDATFVHGTSRRGFDELLRILKDMAVGSTSERPDRKPLFSVVMSSEELQPPLATLKVEREEDGTYVVGDLVDAAYGIGETLEEARTHWHEAAHDLYLDLRKHEDRLAPRMERRLAFLRRVFG